MNSKFIDYANSFLNETPFYHQGKNHVPNEKETIIGQTFSKQLLEDDFKYVTTVKVDLQDVAIYISDGIYRPNKIVVIAVITGSDGRFVPVGFLHLSKNPTIKINGLSTYVQVCLVHVIEDYRKSQVAFNMYLAVVSIGYNIISDDEQYEGAKRLWKTLAGVASKIGFSVKIWDNVHNKMIGDYDGTNIPDSTIWNTDNFAFGIILTLQKN